MGGPEANSLNKSVRPMYVEPGHVWAMSEVGLRFFKQILGQTWLWLSFAGCDIDLERTTEILCPLQELIGARLSSDIEKQK